MKLKIDRSILEILPSFHVICYTMDVINQTTDEVSTLLQEKLITFYHQDEVTNVVNYPIIKAGRDGYKRLGKDPSHTRLACEALLRRAIKDGTLYRLGDLIDLGNLISVLTMRSICVVDKDKVIGDIYIRLGTKEDYYETINRGILNVQNIPIYLDQEGFFGNPSSDTKRTMITKNTKSILIMMICFDNFIDNSEALMIDLYKKYAQAKNIQRIMSFPC